MTVRRSGPGRISLEGACPVEEAETLLSLLLAEPSSVVDLSGCTRLHTALVQVLLAARPETSGPCRDPFVSRWVEPLLASFGGGPGNPARMGP